MVRAMSASGLAQPVTALAGVGPERGAQLKRLGVSTIEDLLLLRPRRHEDRRRWTPIAALAPGPPALTHGQVVALGVKWYARHTKSIFELIVQDGTARLHCRWWNAPYLEKYYSRGDQVVLFGKLVRAKPRTMDHPETEIIEGEEELAVHLNRITPIYPLTEGLSQRWLRGLVWRALAEHGPGIADPAPAFEARIARASLANGELFPAAGGAGATPRFSRAEAIRRLHFPEHEAEPELARRRLALDEFVQLQLGFRRRRQNFNRQAGALPAGGDNRWMRPFLRGLGWPLTAAQKRVLGEIRRDLSGPHPMRRLLQGDVGSGKTLVAAGAALMALESGFDVAFMAPTEILAGQQWRVFQDWLTPLAIPVELWTGARKPAAASGGIRLSVGTHALLESGYEPSRLGLVIIDEQHKFGVAQRERLVKKGRYPHLLVMTATPIPRTLGLTLYGELDLSTLDELPPGRGRITTYVRPAGALPKVWEFVRSRLRAGRQAYVVYPRIEEDAGKSGEAGELRAVLAGFERLREVFAPWRVECLHGRLSPAEKEAVMAAFRANDARVLVATSVIEVGVDVPNATVMVIENAERFGLAQLHQMRGRIGRGARDSHCVLISRANASEALDRLQVLTETNDGFQIAEADLRLRGPGEMLGRQQSGQPPFRFGDLQRDFELLRQARDWVAAG